MYNFNVELMQILALVLDDNETVSRFTKIRLTVFIDCKKLLAYIKEASC